MLRVGITGGIGSGKSMVCGYFESQRVPVYYADREAGHLIDLDPGIRKKIISYFGRGAYSEKGLNKNFIRKKIFNDPDALSTLNKISHPPLLRHFDRWCKLRKIDKELFVIKEAALIFESDSYKSLDFIVCVVAPQETRIGRIMRRDKKSREEIEKIINSQWSDEEKIRRSDFIIYSNDEELLLPEIVKLHRTIIKKAQLHGK